MLSWRPVRLPSACVLLAPVKRSLPILIIAVLLAALAAGCGGSSGPKSVPADGVAVVGSQVITKAKLKQLTDEVRASYTAQKRPFPKQGTVAYNALRDQLLQFLIQNKEFEQKAKDLGVEVTAKDVQARLAQVKQQYFGGDEAKYRAALKSQGLTEQAYIENTLTPGLLGEHISNKLTQDLKVSDAVVRQYYNSHGQYEKRSVRHILVNSSSLANQLYQRLKNGESFPALAKKYSKDPGSASQGGKLDISRGQTVPEFDATAFSLKTGQISKPVHTQFGWHIIQALGPVQKTPFAQVKEAIRQQLLQQQRTVVMSKFVNDLKKGYCGGKIGYQVGYAPANDPCTALTTSTATPSTPTT
jgi:foldase protein PrsA